MNEEINEEVPVKKVPRDKNGSPIKVGDCIQAMPVEKPGFTAVGPVQILYEDDSEMGLMAWTRDGRAIEKAHFRYGDCVIIAKAAA